MLQFPIMKTERHFFTLSILFYAIPSVLLTFPLFLFRKRNFLLIEELLKLFHFRFNWIPLLILTLSMCLIIFYDLFYFSKKERFAQNYEVIKKITGKNSLWYVNLSLSALSGYFEELLFRGYLLIILTVIIRFNYLIVIFILSIFFGLFHLSQGKAAFFLSTLVSMLFFYTVKMSENIIIPMVFHTAFNYIQLQWIIPYQKKKFGYQ